MSRIDPGKIKLFTPVAGAKLPPSLPELTPTPAPLSGEEQQALLASLEAQAKITPASAPSQLRIGPGQLSSGLAHMSFKNPGEVNGVTATFTGGDTSAILISLTRPPARALFVFRCNFGYFVPPGAHPTHVSISEGAGTSAEMELSDGGRMWAYQAGDTSPPIAYIEVSQIGNMLFSYCEITVVQ